MIYRLFTGVVLNAPDAILICLNALICSSMLLGMWAIKRSCAQSSACEHLLCTIKTVLTKYYWSAVIGKTQSAFSTVLFTGIIGRIVVKSEFKLKFRHTNTQDTRCHSNRASALCRLKKYSRTNYKKLTFVQIFLWFNFTNEFYIVYEYGFAWNMWS